MARRKSKIGVLGIGSLPLTPAVDKPRETLRSFTENYVKRNSHEAIVMSRRNFSKNSVRMPSESRHSSASI
jgi:hypothetical protein